MDGVGVLIEQTDAGQLLGLALLILHAADNGFGNQLAARCQSGGRVSDQRVSDIVRCGDGLAVVVDKAFLDLNGEGDGAVVMLFLIDGSSGGLVHDHLAELIENDGVIVVDQVTDHLVGRVVGPPGVAEVAGDFGGAAVDNLVLMLFSRSSGLNGVLGLLCGGILGVFSRILGLVGAGLFYGLCAAGKDGAHHQGREKQSEKLLHILFHFYPPVF